MFGGATHTARPAHGRRVPADHLIMERRRQEEARNSAQRVVDFNAHFDQRARFEVSGDSRLKKNAIERRMNELLASDVADLERRREKLRKLLASEHEMLEVELVSTGETPLEKQARMRSRAKELREKREEDRKKVAQDKTDQLYMLNCEPLRALRSQQEYQAVMEERNFQMQQQAQIRDQEKMVDDMYKAMWDQDRQAKDMRAQVDAERRQREAALQRHVLENQMEEAQKRKQREIELIEEEKQLRLQQQQQMAEDEARAAEARQQQSQQRLAELNRHNRITMRQRAEEMRKEMELDMSLITDVLGQGEADTQKRAQQKAKMREEARLYMEYVNEQKRQQKEYDEMVDQLRVADINKTLQKQVDKWDREAAARKKLMDEVVATRQQQMAEKIERNKQAQLEARQEEVELDREMEEYKHEEAEHTARQREQMLQRKQELKEQAHYQQQRRVSAKKREEDEIAAVKQHEAQTEARLQQQLMSLSLSGTGVRK